MAKRLSWIVSSGVMGTYAVLPIKDKIAAALRNLGDYEVIVEHKLKREGHRVYASVPDELAMLVMISPGAWTQYGTPDIEDITNDDELDHTQIR